MWSALITAGHFGVSPHLAAAPAQGQGENVLMAPAHRFEHCYFGNFLNYLQMNGLIEVVVRGGRWGGGGVLLWQLVPTHVKTLASRLTYVDVWRVMFDARSTTCRCPFSLLRV